MLLRISIFSLATSDDIYIFSPHHTTSYTLISPWLNQILPDLYMIKMFTTITTPAFQLHETYHRIPHRQPSSCWPNPAINQPKHVPVCNLDEAHGLSIKCVVFQLAYTNGTWHPDFCRVHLHGKNYAPSEIYDALSKTYSLNIQENNAEELRLIYICDNGSIIMKTIEWRKFDQQPGLAYVVHILPKLAAFKINAPTHKLHGYEFRAQVSLHDTSDVITIRIHRILRLGVTKHISIKELSGTHIAPSWNTLTHSPNNFIIINSIHEISIIASSIPSFESLSVSITSPFISTPPLLNQY